VGQQHRFPDRQDEYYKIDDGDTMLLDEEIFHTEDVGPILYIEVQVVESDSGAILEDDVDWLGSLSLLFTADELLAFPDGTRTEWHQLSEYAKVQIQIEVGM